MLLTGLAITLLCGLASLLMRRDQRTASIVGSYGAVVGCILGFIPAFSALLGGGVRLVDLGWSIPGGSLSIGLDALSALFLLPLFLLGACAAAYGRYYLDRRQDDGRVGVSWFCFNLLIVSMAGLLLARNGVFFLVCWETMALSSFFLVLFDSESRESRDAAWVYFTSTHIGTAFLLVMFILAADYTGSFEFGGQGCFSGMSGPLAGLVFLLALVGFGAKAGLAPAHVWLPEAHPAAPSHVSALMSGVMVKTGIYGIVRILTFFDRPPLWWGFTLLAAGVATGVIAILYSSAQTNLKRALAYSTVENVGIICIGLGLGTVGKATGNAPMAALGFAGALLHVINHSLFKGLLFFAAGSVIHSTGLKSLERMGGLFKRMRFTGAAFLLGAVAIAGLPPLNGFVSEFLIFLSAFGSISAHSGNVSVLASLLAIAAVALTGGLALLAFARAFGIAFLGEPRCDKAAAAHESPVWMLAPMFIPAAGCLIIGLLPFLAFPLLEQGVSAVLGSRFAAAGAFVGASSAITAVSAAAIALLCATAALAAVRKLALRGRQVRRTVTWDCGYAAPTARMQYTSTSFAQPALKFFGLDSASRVVTSLFPSSARLAFEVRDFFLARVYEPVFRWTESASHRLRFVQQGRVQVYVLYVVLTLIALLALKLG
jgi:hydrogenase-4 component B